MRQMWRGAGGRRGVTGVEYALIASALAFVLVAVFTALGPKIGQAIGRVGVGL